MKERHLIRIIWNSRVENPVFPIINEVSAYTGIWKAWVTTRYLSIDNIKYRQVSFLVVTQAFQMLVVHICAVANARFVNFNRCENCLRAFS